VRLQHSQWQINIGAQLKETRSQDPSAVRKTAAGNVLVPFLNIRAGIYLLDPNRGRKLLVVRARVLPQLGQRLKSQHHLLPTIPGRAPRIAHQYHSINKWHRGGGWADLQPYGPVCEAEKPLLMEREIVATRFLL
jgi:hypothetical protein